MGKIIYLDNAATTAVREEVVEAMLPYYADKYGNPSGLYETGVTAKKAIEEARSKIADTLSAKPGEIYFTSGGTEADNWALKAAVMANRNKKNHIITSKIEHHAILHSCEFLQAMGIDVTYIDADENGIISPDKIKKSIRPTTAVISIMFANNEVGTIQPVKEIAKIAKKNNIIFHTDAVQAYGHVNINVNEYCVDMLSASAHKFNGPKGVGFLYIRDGVNIGSFMHGGAQERKKRAGTENAAGIVGMAKAAELAVSDIDNRAKKEMMLRDHIIRRVENEIPYARLNGHRKKRLPGNTNFSFQFIEGESLILMLDMEGICASSGSACSAGSKEPSHVLMALGLPESLAYSALRMTVSEYNTLEEIDFTIDTLKRIINDLRKNSEEYNEYIKYMPCKRNTAGNGSLYNNYRRY